MTRICTTCTHPNKEEIDRLLVEGTSYRNIAKQYTLSVAAVYRHRAHLNGALVKAKEAEKIILSDNLLDQVKDLQAKALGILTKAQNRDDFRAATSAIREAIRCTELLAKLQGQLKDGPTINILISSEWIELRTVILEALEPYPEASISVSKALESLANGRNSK